MIIGTLFGVPVHYGAVWHEAPPQNGAVCRTPGEVYLAVPESARAIVSLVTHVVVEAEGRTEVLEAIGPWLPAAEWNALQERAAGPLDADRPEAGMLVCSARLHPRT